MGGMRNLHSQSTQEAELRLTPQLQAAGEAGPANGSVALGRGGYREKC